MVDVFVPFSPTDPKSRLSPVLDDWEREAFARVLLDDVLDALAATVSVAEPIVLSTTALADDPGVPVRVDERALTPAVNAALDDSFDDASALDADDEASASAASDGATDDPSAGVAVVMADLALATPDALADVFDASGDVVLAPGRDVGTNALRTRTPTFHVDYHGTSFLDHRATARDVGASVSVVDSHRLATDVDGPDELADVLAHGEGAAADWLRDRGFELAVDDDRVRAVRDGD